MMNVKLLGIKSLTWSIVLLEVIEISNKSLSKAEII